MSPLSPESIRTPVAARCPEESAGAPPFSAKLLFSALSGMHLGRLEMRLPDGSTRVFGQGDCVIADIRVNDSAFFKKCLLRGDIGFAEAYMDGDWDTSDLTAVFSWFILNADAAPTLSGSAKRSTALGVLRLADRIGHLLRANTRDGAKRNIAEHYDLSNDFFALWLDRTMLYSSALFESPGMTLEAAQTAKIDRLCRLLKLKPGATVLEIGCGWGAFAVHAATHYGAKVTGLTLSERQAETARRRVTEAGLGGRVEILIRDFRDFEGKFDRIVSIEMMEALGHDNVPGFCTACDRLLNPGGLMALQFITCPETRYDDLRKGVDFIQKHIFPGSLLLSLNRVNKLLADRGGFGVADLRDLSGDYAETLRRWAENFEEKKEAVTALGFDERFLRKWRYYLRYCEAAFARRHIGVVQALYSRPNNPVLGGYAL